MALQLEGLTKRYGDVVALDGCTFRVEPGRVMGFLGRNGSGKTTAMRSIFGLVRLEAGRVLWRGSPVGHGDRLTSGYMPEERGLYPRMRAAEQVEFFGRLHGLSAGAARRSAEAWLRRLDLGDRFDTPLEALSHGNQQRVQLAASLVGEPDLLVLDEPFSGLDPVAAAALADVIRGEARRGAAVVFSSHQLDLVEDVCDDIAIITNGKVVLTGDLRQVRKASPYRYLEVERPRDSAQVVDWSRLVAGASVLSAQDGQVRLRVAAEVSLEDLIPSLSRAGAIESLRFGPPTLTDIFLEAVKG